MRVRRKGFLQGLRHLSESLGWGKKNPRIQRIRKANGKTSEIIRVAAFSTVVRITFAPGSPINESRLSRNDYRACGAALYLECFRGTAGIRRIRQRTAGGNSVVEIIKDR
jgi:hypothetical protein